MSAIIIRHPLLKESPIPVRDEFQDHIWSEIEKPWHKRMGQVPPNLVDKVRLLEEQDRGRCRILEDFVDHLLGVTNDSIIDLPAHSCEVTETKFLELARLYREENFRGYEINTHNLCRCLTPYISADHLESRILKVFVLAHPNKPWALPDTMEQAATRNLRFLDSGKIPRMFHRDIVEEWEAQLRFCETVKRLKGKEGKNRSIFQKVRELREKVFDN